MRALTAHASALLLSYALVAPVDAQSGLQRVPAPDPSNATLAAHHGEWLVWVRSRVTGSRRRHVPRRQTDYLLQRRGQPHARLVYSTAHPSTEVGTVCTDGTALLHEGPNNIVRVHPDGRTDRRRLVPSGRWDVLEAYPDGMVAQPYVLNTVQPLYWVPMHECWPQPAARRRLGHADVSGAPRIVRHRNELAWTEGTPARLVVYDLDSARRRSVALSHEELGGVRAYDGETASIGTRNYDVAIGRAYAGTQTFKRIFAVRNLRAYYAVTHRPSGKPAQVQVRAVHVTAPDGPSVLVAEVPWRGPTHTGRIPHHVRDLAALEEPNGLSLWTGHRWKRYRWLRRPSHP